MWVTFNYLDNLLGICFDHTRFRGVKDKINSDYNLVEDLFVDLKLTRKKKAKDLRTKSIYTQRPS